MPSENLIFSMYYASVTAVLFFPIYQIYKELFCNSLYQNELKN
jgi:hypothetical protein